MNVLVIIDPQIDFVSGTLAVPGADKAMQHLYEWMQRYRHLYDCVYISMDQHPINHCSFASEGGIWPAHCVRYTEGAALIRDVAKLLPELLKAGKQIHFIEKATEPRADSYSAFSTSIPPDILEAECVYLAGIAGDYCVKASEEDLLEAIPRERIKRIEEAIAWIQKPQG